MYLHTCSFRLDRLALLFHWTCSDILSPSPFDLQPELRDTDQFEFAVSLITYEAHRRTERQNASVAALEQEVKVASSSNPGTVAGSIAGRVRSGERCVLAWDREFFCSSLAGVERRITHCKWPVDLVVCFKKAHVNTFRFGLYIFYRVCVQAIGATSVGIAVKSVAIARQYLYDDRHVFSVCLLLLRGEMSLCAASMPNDRR